MVFCINCTANICLENTILNLKITKNSYRGPSDLCAMANQALFFKLKITLNYTGCSFLPFSLIKRTIRLSVQQLFKCKLYAIVT